MLRIHLLQQWYSLSNPAMEEALIEVPTMRRFAAIELINDRIHDETTILTFRHLLEKHGLGEQIFDTVKSLLKNQAYANMGLPLNPDARPAGAQRLPFLPRLD